MLAVSLGRYKWYQSKTPDNVLARRLSPKGGGHKARTLELERGGL